MHLAQAFDVVLPRSQQQVVAGQQHLGGHWRGRGVAVTFDGENRDAEGFADAGRQQALAYQLAVVRHNGLEQAFLQPIGLMLHARRRRLRPNAAYRQQPAPG